MADTYTHRVLRGARLLDAAHPGWAYKVRLSDLAMEDSTRCVIGQTFDTEGNPPGGPYEQGLKVLGLTDETAAVGGGFDLPRPCSVPFSTRQLQWDRLNELWKVQIRQRRGASGTRGNR